MLQFLSTVTNLGIVKADTNHYFPVTAYDTTSTDGIIIYGTTGTTSSFTSLPGGLSIDPREGYVYGWVLPQSDYLTSYSFTVRATKIYPNLSLTTVTNTYTLTVLDNHADVVKINTGTLSLTAGIPSDISISATHLKTAYGLKYAVVGSGVLPSGVSLNSDTGNIVGIPSTTGSYTATIVVWSTYYNPAHIDGGAIGSSISNFDVNLDNGSSVSTYGLNNFVNDGTSTSTFSTIPFDTNLTGTNYSYSFTTQSVTINVLPSKNNDVYTGIYAKPHLIINKRIAFSNFINDSSIFIPNLIYRLEDDNFGVQEKIKMYIEFGIQELTLNEYVTALEQNFNRRRLIFGDVKVAHARDPNGVHIYDVIYVDVVDNIEGVRPTIYSNNEIYHPASIQNMRGRLSSIVLPDLSYISVDEYYLPKYMRTPQAGSYLPTEYIKVVPLCYALPGTSSRIVRKIKKSGFNFKQLDFDVDRIYIDQLRDQAGTKYLVFPRTSITEVNTDDLYITGDDEITIVDEDGNLILRD